MGNKYQAIKDKTQKIYNETAEKYVFYAFNEEQFQEGMKKIGAKFPAELYKMGDTGAFYKKVDAPKIKAMWQEINQIEKEAWQSGGYEYARDAFICEMGNHEYGYTGDLTETLEALDLTPEAICISPDLLKGLTLALATYGELPRAWMTLEASNE